MKKGGYFTKWERFVPPVDGHDTSNSVDVATTGYSGPINVTATNQAFAADKLVLAAASEIGIPYSESI